MARALAALAVLAAVAGVFVGAVPFGGLDEQVAAATGWNAAWRMLAACAAFHVLSAAVALLGRAGRWADLYAVVAVLSPLMICNEYLLSHHFRLFLFPPPGDAPGAAGLVVAGDVPAYLALLWGFPAAVGLVAREAVARGRRRDVPLLAHCASSVAAAVAFSVGELVLTTMAEPLWKTSHQIRVALHAWEEGVLPVYAIVAAAAFGFSASVALARVDEVTLSYARTGRCANLQRAVLSALGALMTASMHAGVAVGAFVAIDRWIAEAPQRPHHVWGNEPPAAFAST